MVMLNRLKTWLPLIGSLAWGVVFVLKGIGEVTAASGIESFLTLLGINPSLSEFDLAGLATGAGAIYKIYKLWRDRAKG